MSCRSAVFEGQSQLVYIEFPGHAQTQATQSARAADASYYFLDVPLLLGFSALLETSHSATCDLFIESLVTKYSNRIF